MIRTSFENDDATDKLMMIQKLPDGAWKDILLRKVMQVFPKLFILRFMVQSTSLQTISLQLNIPAPKGNLKNP